MPTPTLLDTWEQAVRNDIAYALESADARTLAFIRDILGYVDSCGSLDAGMAQMRLDATNCER
ncbi:MAG TPA: hypothetical protein PLK67_05915 [Bryobacteraceae bacterium]|nr:hypothetical protein [Bryobacteraceae bacterium]